MDLIQRQSIGPTIVTLISFLVINLVLVSIFGFLTIDSWANINSRVGAIILSFFLPFFIVYLTRNMPALERLMKFGFGFMIYAILVIIIAGLPVAITSGLVPSLTIALGVLYYGGKLLKTQDH